MQRESGSTIPRKKQSHGETYCGADCKTYKWSQTISDADIVVPVPPDVVSAADVDVKGTCENLRVKVKAPDDGEWKTLIDGWFPFKTKSSEMMWSLEKGKHISIHIEKVKERWWDCLLKDDSSIDLEEFELSRPASDLTDEEEMTLQRMWRKELEKRNGAEGGTRPSPPLPPP